MSHYGLYKLKIVMKSPERVEEAPLRDLAARLTDPF